MDHVTFGKGKDPLVNYTQAWGWASDRERKGPALFSRIVYLLNAIKSMFFLELMS